MRILFIHTEKKGGWVVAQPFPLALICHGVFFQSILLFHRSVHFQSISVNIRMITLDVIDCYAPIVIDNFDNCGFFTGMSPGRFSKILLVCFYKFLVTNFCSILIMTAPVSASTYLCGISNPSSINRLPTSILILTIIACFSSVSEIFSKADDRYNDGDRRDNP